MAGALQGIRVIDFGQYIAGPMTAMFLADNGADVIRVDPPGGPRYDGDGNATWNRGKRSIVLDLKAAPDRETARRLIETADVVIENFRPGVMARLGVGPAEMTAANPRLVYCSLPGFASDDPRAGVAAWEGVVSAATAMYRPNPAAKTGRPVYSAIAIPSSFAAIQAALSIAMALASREHSGKGQIVEVPLFDATFTVIGSRIHRIHNETPSAPKYNWNRPHPTKDGRWFYYNRGNRQFQAFVKAIGADAFMKAGLSLEEIGQRVDALFRQRTAREWEDYCADFKTEGTLCRTSAEWLKDDHAIASKIVADFDDPKLGKFRGPGINVRMSETPGAVRSPRPQPDAHRAEILKELSSRKAVPGKPNGPPRHAALEGIKVLDLCIVIAGPTCGRTLAEFGADVVKIDGPQANPVRYHTDINRGKRSIILDLKSEEGLKVFWRLLEDADVVLQNFRAGVADRLGVGYEAVRKRRPDIIYASMNTFGQIGPYADRPGHDSIAQAATGMQERYGDTKAVMPYQSGDYGTGLMGAFAVAAALLHRKRTGQGQHVDTSLAYTTTMVQSSLMQDYQGKKWDEPRGQDALGTGPLNRAYQAGDGWLFLAARPADLARCAAIADLAGLGGASMEKALEERMRTRSVTSWVTTLVEAGIGAHRCVPKASELMDDLWVRSHGLSLTRPHDVLGPITTTGPAVRLSATPVKAGRPAPKPGSDAASILKDIGLAGELDRLVRDRVVIIDEIDAE